ncbi:glycoside hydrolase [Lasiosphaeria ovina]|uniref:lytic cellulose monooxygenase (C4-dehydrogenating) n=1 Tax=Lasiosphaeria ovina TaxID=92902 RepID=A0AAE0MXG8_9PEZI|nr:glycoside hydrolase [Lasiosphaeria ovina]
MLLNDALLALLALATAASAHTTMSRVFVNGKDQGEGKNKYIRSPVNDGQVQLQLDKTNNTTPFIACNSKGNIAVPQFVKASPGDKLTFQWSRDDPKEPVIDPSHKGPILTYIAPFFATGFGDGPIWSKIAEEGFVSPAWATEKMRNFTGGKVDFNLPKTLAPGKYMVRQELIPLHLADKRGDIEKTRGPEFYPSCVQFEVVGGSGTAVPNQNFDFNKGYKFTDPGFDFNIHIPFTTYPIPGPPIWDAK